MQHDDTYVSYVCCSKRSGKQEGESGKSALEEVAWVLIQYGSAVCTMMQELSEKGFLSDRGKTLAEDCKYSRML